MRSLRTVLTRLRRRTLAHRRLLASLFAGAAVLVGLHAAAAPARPAVQVWTAAHDLSSGTVLGRSDLAQVGFAPGSVPSEVIDDVGAVLGRTLGTPLPQGQPLTRSAVVGSDLAQGHPGTVAAPVRITDPAVVDLLRVGDRISLISTDPQGRRPTTRLAEDVTVIALPRAQLAGAGDGMPGRLVVLAVPPERADTIAAAGSATFLTIVWSR